MNSQCFLIVCLFVGTSAAMTNPANAETADHWNGVAGEELKRAKSMKPNIAVAKNVILFLGDGMGISTVTASRILKGQLNNQPGEEQLLSFEEFPHVALSKTYTTDSQTGDSAGTATAFLSGVKTKSRLLGVDARVGREDCESMVEEAMLDSIFDWSKAAGKSVGLVTTTRVTHATPGALYSHTPQRFWESDYDMRDAPSNCTVKDIAAQLVDDTPDMQVILGGGREKFMMNATMDPEDGPITKGRLDGRDLIEEWKSTQQYKGRSYKYVWNQAEFDAVNPQETDYLLGLFSRSNMNFEIDREQDIGKEPSLAEMSVKAVQILSKNPKGYFLFVEGGRIDHGHHYSQAVRAVHDTLAFADAVSDVVAMTKESDTLIVATADHSHVFTIGGYPTRGNPIFGLADNKELGLQMGMDGKPFTTLGYTNGPGAYATVDPSVRPNLTNISTDDKNYRQQSAVPLIKETHGGEDVAIYARGPMSHLFHGVHEQNYIAHVMAYASCVGSYSSPDSCAKADVANLADLTDDGTIFKLNIYIFFMILFNAIISLQ